MVLVDAEAHKAAGEVVRLVLDPDAAALGVVIGGDPLIQESVLLRSYLNE